jgi:hypothetical protein
VRPIAVATLAAPQLSAAQIRPAHKTPQAAAAAAAAMAPMVYLQASVNAASALQQGLHLDHTHGMYNLINSWPQYVPSSALQQQYVAAMQHRYYLYYIVCASNPQRGCSSTAAAVAVAAAAAAVASHIMALAACRSCCGIWRFLGPALGESTMSHGGCVRAACLAPARCSVCHNTRCVGGGGGRHFFWVDRENAWGS